MPMDIVGEKIIPYVVSPWIGPWFISIKYLYTLEKRSQMGFKLDGKTKIKNQSGEDVEKLIEIASSLKWWWKFTFMIIQKL